MRPKIAPAHTFPRLRALTWHNEVLFASCAYTLLSATVTEDAPRWQSAGYFRPKWWRNLTASTRLSSRLCREGFHALVVLKSGHMVAAVPKAIITLLPGETEFRISHELLRGTRPLHIAATPDGTLYWGEYFDNAGRKEVHIYLSVDRGITWEVAYTFPAGSIRHIHNIVYDEWENCLWILTGDEGSECRILRASVDLKNVDAVISGGQQARAVALVPTRNALYFSTDTPSETNYVYRLGRNGVLVKVATLGSSSLSACQMGHSIFFSTMAEPSRMNSSQTVKIYRSPDGDHWEEFIQWRKDLWPMRLFQYGNATFPGGQNTTRLLALSTVAVTGADMQTTLWRI